jgi:hypothetical protein
MMNETELMIAVSGFSNLIPKDEPLKARLDWAMKHVRKHQRDIFWMSYEINDDAMFRTALAGVMVGASEDEKALITKSVKPLKALNAAISGVPVDFSGLDMEGILPLMEMWRDTGRDAS